MAFYKFIGTVGTVVYPTYGNLTASPGDIVNFGVVTPPNDGQWQANAGPANSAAVPVAPAAGPIPALPLTGQAQVWGGSSASWATIAPAGLPSYAPQGLLNRYDPFRNAYNYKPANTRKLRAGLGRAARGGQSRHLIISDSSGAGCTNGVASPNVFDRSHAWPLQMRDELARNGVPVGGSGIYRLVDGLLNAPSVWTSTGTGWTNGAAYITGTSSGATLTLTPDVAGTAVDVWYYDSASFIFTVSVGGAVSGVGFATVTGTGSNVWRKVTLLGVTVNGTSTTVVITKSNASASVLAGAAVWTPNAGLQVHNASQSGATASGTGAAAWVDNTSLGLVYQKVAGKARTVTDLSVNGTTTATSATAAFVQEDVGKELVLLGGVTAFAPNTYIVSVTNATTIVMSNAATGTASGITCQIDRDPDCIHICLGGNDLPAASPATVTAALTTIRNTYPNSDCILYVEEQKNDTFIPAVTWEAYAAALYQLADTLDVPLVDIRDRVGNYATGYANGLYGDNAAHLTSAAYSDWGRNVGMLLAG